MRSIYRIHDYSSAGRTHVKSHPPPRIRDAKVYGLVNLDKHPPEWGVYMKGVHFVRSMDTRKTLFMPSCTISMTRFQRVVLYGFLETFHPELVTSLLMDKYDSSFKAIGASGIDVPEECLQLELQRPRNELSISRLQRDLYLMEMGVSYSTINRWIKDGKDDMLDAVHRNLQSGCMDMLTAREKLMYGL